MTELLEVAGGLGVGALLGVIIFLMYRQDRKASEKRYLEAWQKSEERLTMLIDRDQETREESTKIQAELRTLIEKVNGRLK